jgi:H+/Cl- antiporter ClcA
MNSKKIKENISLLLKWLIISLLVGFLSGSASAFFLVTLEKTTQIREQNNWIIALLPIGGLIIGLCYHYLGKEVVRGNNLLLEEYEKPKKTIRLKMVPLIYISTLITHLLGGSAGREGTAVQMGGAIADQFSFFFKTTPKDRKTLIILGISAGFASVFGTPLAGALFALEVLYFSKIEYRSIILSFTVAYIAYFTVEFWQIQHTQYSITTLPKISFTTLSWITLCSMLFGFAAMLFSRSTHFWGSLFSKTIKYPPLRPFIGGLILILALYLIGTTKYIGLGVPMIVDAFTKQNIPSDFLLKILFTGFTLGSGFKGGEVTPLFFVGATLGSALSAFVPLPISFLAAIGFVAVFSGATHTPIACTFMGMELFGYESGLYIAFACVIAYFSSGSIGIYSSQIVKGPKYYLYQKFTKKDLENF